VTQAPRRHGWRQASMGRLVQDLPGHLVEEY